MTIPLRHSDLLSTLPGITHAFTTRNGRPIDPGVPEGHAFNMNTFVPDAQREHVDENRRSVLQQLGRPDAAWISLKQVHGADIVQVTGRAGRMIEADGLLTRDPDVVIAVLAADCVPIILADSKNRVIAAVHAGWKGTQSRIVAHMVARLGQLDIPPKQLYAALGPAIGPCCFEIRDDVAKKLRDAYPDATDAVQSTPGHTDDPKSYADLWSLNRSALMQAGIPGEQIDTLRVCTVCNEEFFSYRREGKLIGCHAGVIGFSKSYVNRP